MNYKEKFEKFGFVIIRDAFSEKECALYKETALNYFLDDFGKLTRNLNPNYRDGNESTKPLAFNYDYFEPLYSIFTNEKLRKAFDQITNNKTMFLHHSDVHVDTVAGKGWHRDSINNSDGRAGKKWKDMYITKDIESQVDGEKYCIVRAAFYLQEHTSNQDGLFVIAGSHLNDKFNKEMYVKTKTGDVILFDARLLHRGGHRVLKGNHRSAVFWGMGRDNIFSHEHKQAAIARQTYQLGIENYIFNDKLKKILDENNIGY